MCCVSVVCILVAFNSMFSIVIVKKISQFPVNQITQNIKRYSVKHVWLKAGYDTF